MIEKSISLPVWLERGVADLFPHGNGVDSEDSLGRRIDSYLKEKRPLRVKLGIDPTGSEIHLGHSILFRKLRAFQDAGHTAVLIIGDFTAQIGDPTGKSTTRVQLSVDQVEANSLNYLAQLGKGKSKETSLLDFETPGRLEIHRNSTWLKKLELTEIIRLLSNSTVGQMLAKEDFGKRYSSRTPIALHEFLYPLLQGYDSVAVRADIELGGTDQKFNIAIGRDLQRYYKQSPQFGLLLPILVGLDGVQKMSKSIGNTVGLNEDPLSMYCKLEKVPDSLLDSYWTLLTDRDHLELPESARERQKAVALAITANFHSTSEAETAQRDAGNLFVGATDLADDMPEVSLAKAEFPAKAFYLLSALGLCSSSSEARRQIQGGGVRLDGSKITDPNIEFADQSQLDGKVLQLGKKTFRRLTS